MAKKYAEHPRLVIENFLSPEECKELEFIHKSCSTVGYRPNVFSTTLSHLIATNSAHLIMPFVPIRERLKETVEEVFGCEYELFIEFTGLISWCRGASIGWHSDDNRPYLKQRDFAVVCYLNSHGKDFDGGLFHFQDGEPATVVPMIGDVIMYTADNKNIHSVAEVIEGERLTLTLWFTRDSSHDEDAKLVSRLSNYLPHNSNGLHDACIPSPASSNMYWFSPDQAANQESGFDVRVGRMHILGFDIHSLQDAGSLSDASELLMSPLQIANKEQLFSQEFVNILHALQVVQFHRWKAFDMKTCRTGADAGNMSMVLSDFKRIHTLRSIFVRDQRLLDATFGRSSCDNKEKRSIDWLTFFAATTTWEEYTSKLLELIMSSLPCWIAHQSIYSVQSS